MDIGDIGNTGNSTRQRIGLGKERSGQKKSEGGQISIMLGVMMMTFIIFFAFVVNTGMLVNAKINLQNAADLAAYAGASVQARQLTQISYINYEMRRQWKKFLFRIYVLGNMAQDSFQDSIGQSGPMQYYPNRSAPNVDFGAPTTCIMFNPTDNFCHLTKLPSISIPPPSMMDSVADTLRDQLTAIENIRQNNCKGIGLTNLMVNLYWLYNSDPFMQNKSTAGLPPEMINTMKIVQGLTTGLGIVPEELLLKYRIDTLASYVNATVQRDVTKAKADGFLSMPDPSYYERTISAFHSAFYTLGNHTFSGDKIIMDELLPGDGNGALLLTLKPIAQAFDTYAIDPQLGTADKNGGADCLAQVNPISVTQKLTLGVAKDPSILTYYAIRLKGTAQVLFSPFGNLELKAYSAAQPFGSRIGPNLPENSFGSAGVTAVPVNTSQFANTNVAATVNTIPNLPVKEDDSATPGPGQGWNTKEMISAMYNPLQGGGSGNVINTQVIENAYSVAMAPNPWEATRYNIINDEGIDYFVKNFGSDGKAAIWAPIFSPGKSQQQIQDQLKSDVQSLFATNVGGSGGVTGGSGGAVVAQIQAAVLQGLNHYFGSLSQGAGENNSGMNVLRITNPFRRADGSPIGGSPTLFLSQSSTALFKSSWNSVNSEEKRQSGRVGYSVKFISFDSLTSNKLTTNGSNSWTNGLGMDSEAEGDIPFIKH